MINCKLAKRSVDSSVDVDPVHVTVTSIIFSSELRIIIYRKDVKKNTWVSPITQQIAKQTSLEILKYILYLYVC